MPIVAKRAAADRKAVIEPRCSKFTAFMAQFALAAAYNITYAPYVSDYSRYMPQRPGLEGSSRRFSSERRAPPSG